jgi:DNA-directed RNA polymerase sigma subunit (sigma70/sigma32)
MSQKDDIQKLILEHNRRLQLLKEKKARLGISADVSLDVEIEDIENEIKKLETALKDLERVAKPSLRITSPIPKSANNNLQRTISDKQKEMLAFIENFIEENGLSPTLEEIRRGLKISTKSLVDLRLKALEKLGLLTRLPNTSRSICLTSGQRQL